LEEAQPTSKDLWRTVHEEALSKEVPRLGISYQELENPDNVWLHGTIDDWPQHAAILEDIKKKEDEKLRDLIKIRN